MQASQKAYCSMRHYPLEGRTTVGCSNIVDVADVPICCWLLVRRINIDTVEVVGVTVENLYDNLGLV